MGKSGIILGTIENGTMTFDDIVAGINPEDLGYVNQHGLSREHIFDAVKASLKRLDLDYIDVLQCYRLDLNIEISDITHALHDVVQAWHARYIGMSSCWAWRFQAIQSRFIPPCIMASMILTSVSWTAPPNNGLTAFVSMQFPPLPRGRTGHELIL